MTTKKEKQVQIPTKAKKSQQKQNNAPKYDLFTALCRSDLKVECVKELRFHPKRMWRFDYAIPEHRIAIEVEGGVWTGGRHTRPKGFLGDIEKYNTATVMGWRLLRTTPEELVSKKTIDMIKTIISGKFSHENS